TRVFQTQRAYRVEMRRALRFPIVSRNAESRTANFPTRNVRVRECGLCNLRERCRHAVKTHIFPIARARFAKAKRASRRVRNQRMTFRAPNIHAEKIFAHVTLRLISDFRLLLTHCSLLTTHCSSLVSAFRFPLSAFRFPHYLCYHFTRHRKDDALCPVRRSE